jgi:tetratricopeptide (TPR) repeat protein
VHAQSEYWIGRAHEVARNWPVAQRQYRRFAALTSRLITLAPNNPEYMSQVAWASIDLGNVQLNGLGNAKEAQRSYENAVHWFGRAIEANPRDLNGQLAQANAYAWLADSYFMQSLWSQSLAARLQQYAIVQRLHRGDVRNAELGYRFALAQRAVGRSMAKVGRKAEARDQLTAARESASRLVEHDPDNPDWLLLRAFVACDLYFQNLGLPQGVSRNALRDQIAADGEALKTQAHPRLTELSRCLRAL